MNRKIKYEKPKITKHVLKIDEVVLTLCKTGLVGATGANLSKCRLSGQAPCDAWGPS